MAKLLLIAVSSVTLMCFASPEDTALTITIRSHKQSYGLADDIIFDFAVSNRTDLAIEIGKNYPRPLADDADFLVFVPLGTSETYPIYDPAWQRVTNNNRAKVIVPPHGLLEFRNVRFNRQKLTECYIKQGSYNVQWVLRKFKEYKSRPTSNTITIDIKEPQVVEQDLLSQLRDKKLYKWFLRDSSREHAEELGRICLQSKLSREEIITLMGPPLLGGGTNSIAYSFAPSQLLEFKFDAEGKIIDAKITGVSIESD